MGSVEREELREPSVLLTKLHPPALRNQTVARERLLKRLQPKRGVRLVVVAAPAGSGKTTLLGTWREAEATRRAIGWVSLDEGDNDPVVLWSHVLEALRRACPTLETPRGPDVVGAARIIDSVLPDLVNRLMEQGDVTLVLDDFHCLRSGTSRESVAWLAEHGPPSFQLVVLTRSDPALPLAALRAHGELLELHADELAFSADEADLLLNDRLDLGLARYDVDDLVDRTEGWPAGLYLAALSLRGSEDRHAFVNRFGGDNRHVVAFLVDEVLEAHEVALQVLMLRCSILERLCGPLCDALLERDDSAEQLTELARTNLFLVPLDDRGEWYRFHHLFRQLLRVQLDARDPGLSPTLHRRAYAWHRDNGSADEAIEHALEAGAFDEARELITSRWFYYTQVARHATVVAWLERLPLSIRQQDAGVLLVQAWVLMLNGQRRAAAASVEAVERLRPLDEGPLPDGFSSLEASLAVLQGMITWGDFRASAESARRAAELEGPTAPSRAVISVAGGWCLYFLGEFDEADRWLADAAEPALKLEQWRVAVSALVGRSLVAEALGQKDEQTLFASRAAALEREHGIEGVDNELPVALGAASQSRGELEDALSTFEHAAGVLRHAGQPASLALALIRKAAVLRALDKDAAAATVVEDARGVIASFRDPGMLSSWLAEVERAPRARRRTDGAALSERELAVLRALTGPLSQREIAREFYLSHSTIHTHTRSVYRKLGVSSRAEAVLRARELGLL
jgi:LuxR family transcriptional regulator, maltose regulon positive regulatory protein